LIARPALFVMALIEVTVPDAMLTTQAVLPSMVIAIGPGRFRL